MLRATTVDETALKVLCETGLNEFQRHIGTLEGVDTVTIHVLEHLGAGDGLDLQRPPEVRKYAAKLIGLDVLPAQIEPGPITIEEDGAIMQPRALVQALIRTVSAAKQAADDETRHAVQMAVREAEAGVGEGGSPYVTMGTTADMNAYHQTVVTAIREVTSEREGKKVALQPEINKLRTDFETKRAWVPLETEQGDRAC